MTSEFLQIAKPLLRTPTAPFHEHFALDFARTFAERRPRIKLRSDRSGNLLLTYEGDVKPSGDLLVLTAHLDHPGLVWRQTIGAGRALFEILGGVDLQQALATGVRIFDLERTATQRGYSAAIVGTAKDPGRRYPLIEIETGPQCRLDTGVFAMWDLPGFRLQGRRLNGRALDDLAGAAVGLAVLDELDRSNAPVRAGLLLTRAEEVGFVGMLAALEAGFLRRKALYINIECSSVKAGAVQGEGPILRVGDRLWVFDAQICGGLAALAKSLIKDNDRFCYQRKLMDSGACEATPLMQAGYRTGAVALPLGNYHNIGPGKSLEPENIHVDDAENLVHLLVQLAHHGVDRALSESGAELDHMLAGRLAAYRDRLDPI